MVLQKSKPMYQTQRLDFSSNGKQNSQAQLIRILLVDDSRVIREGLKAMLAPFEHLLIVGSANDGQVAIEKVEALQPDVVLMDVQMPVMDGVSATRIITQRFTGTKVLVLSSRGNDSLASQLLEAGANGYLLKDTPGDELATAIKAVHSGYGHIGPGVSKNFRINMMPTQDIALEQIPFESNELSTSNLERVKRELVNLKTQLGLSSGYQQFLELQLGLTRATLRKQQRDLQELRKLLKLDLWIAAVVFCIAVILLVFRFFKY